MVQLPFHVRSHDVPCFRAGLNKKGVPGGQLLLPSWGWDVCRPARVGDERCCPCMSKLDATTGVLSRHPGAGLGLALARWIANAHGADVVLARSSQSGATFVAPRPSRR
jgi:hypothetical protein